MLTDKETYKKYADARAKKSPCLQNCLRAFLVGGTVCAIGQGFSDLYAALGIDEESVKTLVPVTLIFIAALLTGIGIFDSAAKFAGAGTLVPITGFANAVTAPALDTKTEGLILGVGAKIFTVAGPVILYGTLSGTAYGVIYYVCANVFNL
jgi:stage V sporulation protein AC